MGFHVKRVVEKMLLAWRTVVYGTNLVLAWLVFRILYRGKVSQGTIAMGRSNGKFSDENTSQVFRYRASNVRRVHYIIDKNSPDFHKVQTLGSVLFRFSFLANLTVFRSEFIIYDTSYYDVIRCDRRKLQASTTINVFHGIHGLKAISKENAEKRTTNDDYVIATSCFEKQIKMKWGFDKDRVLLTGLPRYDNLYNERITSRNCEKAIFCFPTWRPWFPRGYLQPSQREVESFTRSRYFQTIMELANSHELNAFLESKGYRLEIYIHKLMSRYITRSELSCTQGHISILDYDTNIQEKLIRSKFLITDYSSVIFDFLYLGKKVILYQFDRDEYYSKTPGSYVDFDEIADLVVFDYESLFARLRQYIEEDPPQTYAERQLLDKFVKYHDSNACDRLYGHLLRLRED